MTTFKLPPAILVILLMIGIGPAYPQGNPSLDAMVSGAVMAQTTGEPIDGAEVKLTSETGIQRKTQTNPDGTFSVKSIPAGFYSIAVTRSGFVDPEVSQGPRHMRISPGDELKDLRLQMTAASVLSGRVLDENREPMSPAMVVALKVKYVNGRRILLPGGLMISAVYSPFDSPGFDVLVPQSRANELGEYRISGLTAGEYYLAVWHKGPENPTADLPPVYYPGVTDPAAAQPIRIYDGAPLPQMNIQVPRIEGHTAKFKIALPSVTPYDCSIAPFSRKENAPEFQTFMLIQHSANLDVVHFSNMALTVGNDNVTPARVQKIGPANWETSSLPPGAYEMFYNTSCYSGADPAIGKLPFMLSDLDIDAGTLTVPMNASLQGRIRGPEGNPIQLDSLNLRLRPSDLSGLILPTRTPKPKSDGTFAFQVDRPPDTHYGTVVPGHYVFEVGNLPPDVYVSSVKYGGSEVRDSGFDIESGAKGQVEIVLDTPGGTITGIIRNFRGDPVREATITLVPDTRSLESARLWRKSVSDQNGVFSIRGVTPGNYTVFAVMDQKSDSFIDPPFLESYQNQGTKVRVENRGSTNLDLRAVGTGDGR